MTEEIYEEMTPPSRDAARASGVLTELHAGFGSQFKGGEYGYWERATSPEPISPDP